MSAPTPPSDPDALRRFLLGQSDEAEFERVAEFLRSDPSAPAALDRLPAVDTLVAALRRIGQLPATDADPAEVRGLIDRMRVLPARLPELTAAYDVPADAADADDPVARLIAALSPPEGAGEVGRLGGYRVRRVLGRGGMGVVFEAEDPGLARPVALKVMAPGLAADPAAKSRFFREARAAAAIEHDHVVPIYQVGEDRGFPFLAMPLLRGEPLDAALRGGRPLAPAVAARVARDVADGLSAAHAVGLIHRDVKPSNVWLERHPDGTLRRARVFDFGLARRAGAADAVTRPGGVLGTPAYMAPEQAAGRDVDARADLFGLGCVLYEMLTGTRPFQGDGAFAVLTALAVHAPPPAAVVDPAVPPPCPT